MPGFRRNDRKGCFRTFYDTLKQEGHVNSLLRTIEHFEKKALGLFSVKKCPDKSEFDPPPRVLAF